MRTYTYIRRNGIASSRRHRTIHNTLHHRQKRFDQQIDRQESGGREIKTVMTTVFLSDRPYFLLMVFSY